MTGYALNEHRGTSRVSDDRCFRACYGAARRRPPASTWRGEPIFRTPAFVMAGPTALDAAPTRYTQVEGIHRCGKSSPSAECVAGGEPITAEQIVVTAGIGRCAVPLLSVRERRRSSGPRRADELL